MTNKVDPTQDELEQASSRIECDDHHWVSHHIPYFKIWIVQCSICDIYDHAEMNRQLQDVITKHSEQVEREARIDELSRIDPYAYGTDYGDYNQVRLAELNDELKSLANLAGGLNDRTS